MIDCQWEPDGSRFRCMACGYRSRVAGHRNCGSQRRRASDPWNWDFVERIAAEYEPAASGCVDRETFSDRILMCYPCSSRRGDDCTACNCGARGYLSQRATLLNRKCKRNKWPNS